MAWIKKATIHSLKSVASFILGGLGGILVLVLYFGILKLINGDF